MTTEANYEQEKPRRFRDDVLLHVHDAPSSQESWTDNST
jgi:hypothetical protein